MTFSRDGLKWTFHEENVLPAWVAEMDFGLAPAIEQALHDAVDNAITGYPYPNAEDAAAEEATAFWQARYGWTVDPSTVYPAPDVIEGMRRAIMHLTRPGSPVVIHSPVYFPFYGMVSRAGRDLIEVRSHRDDQGRYSLNLDGIDRACDDGAGCILLCNPWNPTGKVFTETELGEVVELATRHDVRIIADEIHGAITYGGATHIPIATLDSDLVITATAASKAWNLPGLKAAQVALTNPADVERWEEAIPREAVGVGTFGLIAAAAAYSDGVEWFDRILGRLEQNRDLLMRAISEKLPDVTANPPEGTYLAWLDMSGYGIEDPADFLRKEAKVALTGGRRFGTGAGQFARFNFATEPDLITEMVDRMGRAFADL